MSVVAVPLRFLYYLHCAKHQMWCLLGLGAAAAVRRVVAMLVVKLSSVCQPRELFLHANMWTLKASQHVKVLAQ